MQGTELAANSQRISKRRYNLLAVAEGGRCPLWVDFVVKVAEGDGQDWQSQF